MAAESTTVGSYLAARLEQLGLRRYFAIPGDYNLALLDEFLANENLEYTYCCNELNAGYAADGYARATGLAALIVTFNCGAFSALNAIAGAYAEDLPVVFVSGGPNTNSAVDLETLHHTIAGPEFGYQRRIFDEVTAHAVTINNPGDAPRQIDRALETCVREHKPVYLEIAANIASFAIDPPEGTGLAKPGGSDPRALEASTDAAADYLNAAVKPVLVAGARLRSWNAIDAFARLVDASGYGVAGMPDAKGMVSETDPGYMGTFWGPISSPGVGEIVDSADAYLFAGPIFSDYSTAGHSALIRRAKLIDAGSRRVEMPGHTFNHVHLADFLNRLADKVEKNPASIDAFRRTAPRLGEPIPPEPADPLTIRHLRDEVSRLLGPDTTLLVETGDSWFNGMKMKLPEGSGFEIQMKYGSIGWSVGATLGYSLGSPKRVIAMIGDGSFQMSAQELSTIVRYGAKPIIFILNNGGYTIEVEIHDGPYNVIQNWDYAGLAPVLAAGGGDVWSTRVETNGELDEALAEIDEHDGAIVIEAVIDRDDCTRELLEWGSRVVTNNARPPRAESAAI